MKPVRAFPLKHKLVYLVIACAVMGIRMHAHAEDVAPNVATAVTNETKNPDAPVTVPVPVAPIATPPAMVPVVVTPVVAPVEGSAPSPVPAAAAASSPAGTSGTEESEYEIDYEEEPADTDEMESPEEPPVKVTRGKKVPAQSATAANPNGGSGGIQGSRAKHRFTPILKSETKSIYQKDGKALDVDTD